MPTDALRSSAERQRRLRYRRKHDLILAQAEMPVSLAEALIDAGLLFEEDASDPQALGDALVASAKRLMNSDR
jgi:hypothetical protein